MRYRCGECGDCDHLTAYAEAIAFGPLGPDGELGDRQDFETGEVFEGSVSCSRHGECYIQVQEDGGEWSTWSACAECSGCGRVGKSSMKPDGWRCQACNGAGGRYVPVAPPAGAGTVPATEPAEGGESHGD